ncbi:MAG: hypothetical protein QMB22_00115 [Dehalococcoidia bacterium]|jgi:hypothetical protein|tara:strand:+ start:5177 stop:5587 length:411 start_codon:yes stop_codon:yes gene_type:complete
MNKKIIDDFTETRVSLLKAMSKFREEDFIFSFDGTTIIDKLLELCDLEINILPNTNKPLVINKQIKQEKDLLAPKQVIMPPQVIHHLASIRHGTINYLSVQETISEDKSSQFNKLILHEKAIIDKISVFKIQKKDV